MKVALIGVTGRVGSRLASELVSRGHEVAGIALHPLRQGRPGVVFAQADARDPGSLTPRLRGNDAVISASRFVTSDPDALLAAVKAAGVGRLLVVGGAGSLQVAPGQALQDSAGFP
jgi:hypothetical protein